MIKNQWEFWMDQAQRVLISLSQSLILLIICGERVRVASVCKTSSTTGCNNLVTGDLFWVSLQLEGTCCGDSANWLCSPLKYSSNKPIDLYTH